MEGWVSIHRQIMDHWIYKERKPFSKREAWFDLILLANHCDTTFPLGNEIIEAKRGQVITSEVKLMERWKWSKTKLRTFLLLLESDGMIVKKSDRKKTTIDLINYGVFQEKQTTEKPEKDHEETAKRPKKDTINNVNNANNANKYKELIVEIINYLNAATGKSFSPDTKESIKLISGRLTEGKTMEQFKHVIDVKTGEWLNDEKMSAWLKPSTLFAQSNFESYLNQKRVIQGGVSSGRSGKGNDRGYATLGADQAEWESLIVGSPALRVQ